MNEDMNDIIQSFYSHANPREAVQMAAYMRDMFPFLGIHKPERMAVAKTFFKSVQNDPAIDWEFVYRCWELPEREFQYLAVNYLDVLKKRLVLADMEHIRHLATNKSWWDTVDGLDRLAGQIASMYPAANKVLLEWSVADNIWLRRIAIDHQLTRKERTDTALLATIIENNLHQTEFFINKAIGWSLRQYSKVNPDWVRRFIAEHREGMASLSVREASKYLK